MGYGALAYVYDTLAWLVIGKAIKSSQYSNLYCIESYDRVLIVGGGTGWILDYLYRLDIPLYIEYVECDGAMMKLSKKRELGRDDFRVDYKQEDIKSFKPGQYDVIITNYLLDVLNEINLDHVMNKLTSSLKASGKWIITDFRQNGTVWGRLLIKSMYYSFKISTGIETIELHDFNSLMLSRGFKSIEMRYFYGKLIFSGVYTRSISWRV